MTDTKPAPADDLEIPEGLDRRGGKNAHLQAAAPAEEKPATEAKKLSPKIAEQVKDLERQVRDVMRSALTVKARKKKADALRAQIAALKGTTAKSGAARSLVDKLLGRSKTEPAERKPEDDRARSLAKKAASKAAKKAARPKKAKAAGKAEGPRPGSKLEKILNLVSRKQGATMKELEKATGIDAHPMRARIYHLRHELGVKIEHDGERYKVAA